MSTHSNRQDISVNETVPSGARDAISALELEPLPRFVALDQSLLLGIHHVVLVSPLIHFVSTLSSFWA